MRTLGEPMSLVAAHESNQTAGTRKGNSKPALGFGLLVAGRRSLVVAFGSWLLAYGSLIAALATLPTNVEELEPLGGKISQVHNLPAGDVARECVLEAFPGDNQMLTRWGFTQLISRNRYLIAIKLQAKFELAGNENDGNRKILGRHAR